MTVERGLPALFIGHGSPMNAIEDNEFRRGWADVARRLPRPAAVLYLPLLYLLAVQGAGDEVTFFNDRVVMGSVSMTSMVAPT